MNELALATIKVIAAFLGFLATALVCLLLLALVVGTAITWIPRIYRRVMWPFLSHRWLNEKPDKTKSGFLLYKEFNGKKYDNTRLGVKTLRYDTPAHYVGGKGEKLIMIDKDNWVLIRWDNGKLRAIHSRLSCYSGNPAIPAKKGSEEYIEISDFQHLRIIPAKRKRT